MKFVSDFLSKNKHCLLLLYLFIYFPWFNYLEEHVTRHFHVIHMKIDDYIPFIEYFIIPYLLWFVYVSVVVLYFMFKDKSEFYKLCAFLFTGMTIFLIISTVYPNGHYLRPIFFKNDNICVYLVKMLYRTDTSTNLFPSIHVYNSIGVHIAIAKSKHLKDNRLVTNSSFILMVSIVMSTMFLKQHSVFDVVTGIVMAALMYSLVYGRTAVTDRHHVLENHYHDVM